MSITSNIANVASTLTVANNVLTIPNAATISTNNVPNSYAISFRNGNSFIFDDGNMHLNANTGTIWINTNSGDDVAINTQWPATGGLSVGGTLKANSGYGSIATMYGVRAWINCGYNGSTMVTRGSGNLSVSRSGVGVYNFTFTSPMPDDNYCVTATAQTPNTNSDVATNLTYNVTPTVNGFSITTARYGDGNKDVSYLCVQVIR